MGKKQTADGRWIIGGGKNSTDYKGFLHWRECYICLTESGATEESVDYLNALKDYAIAHYALGEPIMPPSMTVWVVANGKATAVQADDVKVEDGDYTICGITYSDGAWDYSNAGQGQGGSGLPDYSEASEGDVLSIDSNGDPAWAPPSGGGGDTYDMEINVSVDMSGGTPALVLDKTFAEIKQVFDTEGQTYTVLLKFDPALNQSDHPMTCYIASASATKITFITDIRRVPGHYGVTGSTNVSISWSVIRIAVDNSNHVAYGRSSSGFGITGTITDVIE